MNTPDAHRLTRICGHSLTYRDKVALVTFVAERSWDAASDLADLWDLDPGRQEQIYRLTANHGGEM